MLFDSFIKTCGNRGWPPRDLWITSADLARNQLGSCQKAKCVNLVIRGGKLPEWANAHPGGGECGVIEVGQNHDSFRQGLVILLPRLKRFADVLIGDKQDGTALLGRALKRMLAEQYRYQRGTPLDRWAFAEIYRLWLHELRDHAEPMRQAKVETGFDLLLYPDELVDDVTPDFLGQLPPQQRSALLLVYGEGFDYEDAGRVLDCSVDAVASRLIRASASLADRLGEGWQVASSATVETLYPKGSQHDRTQ